MLLVSVDSKDSELIIQTKTVEALRDDVESRDAEIIRLRDYYKAQSEVFSRENNELQDGKREIQSRLEKVNGEFVADNEMLSADIRELQAKFDAVSSDYKELEQARFMKDERENDARESDERENDKLFFELATVKDDLSRVQAEKDALCVSTRTI
jgi:hypothetical protein